MKNMTRKFSLVMLALFALNANANAEKNINPISDFICNEIEKVELELELFGDITKVEALCIAAINVYEIEEELELDFNTAEYLPADFKAEKGNNKIDWNSIELVELEDDFDIGFDTKAYLPYDFDPYEGMNCSEATEKSLIN